MKFKFKYDSVLTVKNLLIAEKERELREINIEIENQKELIKELENEVLSINEKNFKKNMKTDELTKFKNYQNYLMEKIKRSNGMLKLKEERRERLLSNLIQLNKEKKIIEMLKEKYFQDYLREEKKIEEKQMSEFAIQKFLRKKK